MSALVERQSGWLGTNYFAWCEADDCIEASGRYFETEQEASEWAHRHASEHSAPPAPDAAWLIWARLPHIGIRTPPLPTRSRTNERCLVTAPAVLRCRSA